MALIVGMVATGPLPAPGKLYRWVDRQGNVIYSDRPPRPDKAAPPAETGPDGEVGRYIEFLESEAGAWFGAAARRTVIQTVARTVAQAAADIVPVVPPARWAVGGAFKKPTLPGGERRL
jgi:hypothetical protein